MADARREHQTSDGASNSGTADSPGSPLMLRESVESLSLSLSNQIELLAGELRSRWKNGSHIGIESLGAQYAEITSNDEYLLDLIYHEILIREEFDESPRLEDFISRFPQHADRLSRLFAVHGAIEEDWPDDLLSDSQTTPGNSLPKMIIESSQEKSDFGQQPDEPDQSDSGGDTPLWPRRSRRRPIDPPPGYELLEEVGRGGMAVVYRARQQILNRIVAVKMLISGNMAGPEVLARIQQEARAVAQLHHPGIVQIYEVGEHHELPFLALEFVPGGTLHEWLDGQPLSPAEACRIVEQLARITHFAHERGIVHRDLKPANVLLTERPDSVDSPGTALSAKSRQTGLSSAELFSVKISDFGLARVLDHGSDLTATGQIIGTPSYMAPEQAAGSVNEAAPAQDVYSLGAILYELLTGRPPFRGATLFDTLEQVRSDEPVPPRRLQPRVPRDLETVCLKCLEKTAERRYASALDLAEDLRAVQAGEAVQARPVGVLERSWKWICRFPVTAVLLTVVVMLIAAGVAGIVIESQLSAQREKDANRELIRVVALQEVASQQRDRAEEQQAIAEQQRKKAEDKTNEADRLAQLTEMQRIQAEGARTEAVVARQEAEESLQQAMAAVDALAKYGIELRQMPMQQATSRRILDETLKLYEQLEKSHGESPRLRQQLASALVRSGEIRLALRENDKAGELLTRAIKILDEELGKSPDDITTLELSAYANWVHGTLFNGTNRPTEAVVSFQRCLASHDAVLRLKPDDGPHLKGKANALINLCAAMNNLDRFPESLTLYEEAIQTLRSVRQRYPGDWSTQSELALALHDYSRVLRLIRGHAPAEQAFDEALEIRKRLYQSYPGDTGNRSLYSRLYVSRGGLLQQNRDYENALAQFRLAAGLLEPLVASFPEVYEHQRDLQTVLIFEVMTCIDANNSETGKLRWADLANRLITSRRVFSKDRQTVLRMQEWLTPWCEQLWEDGQAAQSVACWKVLVEGSLWMTASQLISSDQPLTPQEEAAAADAAAWVLVMAPDVALRDLRKALPLARRATELAPESVSHLQTLGAALFYEGNFKAARETLERAAALDAGVDNESPIFSAGAILKAVGQGNPLEARDAAKAMIGLRGPTTERNPLIYVFLAMSQWQLGDHEMGQMTLAKVKEPAPVLSKSASRLRRLLKDARQLMM